MPAMTFSSVDLPQPDGPTMLTNLPSSTVRLMSWRTTNSSPEPGAGNFLVSLSMVMAEDAVAICVIAFPRMTDAVRAL